MLNKKGFSILELLVTAAISTMIFLGFASMSNQMNKELKHSNQRADAFEFRNAVSGLLSNLPTCSCQLNQHLSLIDGTVSVAGAELSRLDSSCTSTATLFAAPDKPVIGSNNGLLIDRIQLKNIESLGAPDKYRGRLSFSYKKDNLLRAIPGFDIEIHFSTDPATPLSEKKVKTCDFVGLFSGGAGGTISGSCPDGQFVNGISEGKVLCSGVAIAGNVSNAPAVPTKIIGPGCSGPGCITADFGPCSGIGCVTNGYACSSLGCTACGEAASCLGGAIGCCAGPNCPRCFKVKPKY
ncbi:MAG: type IV pilus modification PilV family protein [Bdellovibrio sp.]